MVRCEFGAIELWQRVARSADFTTRAVVVRDPPRSCSSKSAWAVRRRRGVRSADWERVARVVRRIHRGGSLSRTTQRPSPWHTTRIRTHYIICSGMHPSCVWPDVCSSSEVLHQMPPTLLYCNECGGVCSMHPWVKAGVYNCHRWGMGAELERKSAWE